MYVYFCYIMYTMYVHVHVIFFVVIISIVSCVDISLPEPQEDSGDQDGPLLHPRVLLPHPPGL